MPAPDIDTVSPGELLPLLGLGRRFRALGKANMIELLRTLPMSVSELLDDWFECAPLKAAVAAGGVQDHQQGPRSGGTGFVLLHHLAGAPLGSVRGRGPWRQGPEAFTAIAESAARRSGATLRTGAPVARIRVENDAVAGVTLESGEEIGAKAVLSTADPARTLLDWVDPVWLDPEFTHAVRNIRYRGCTAVVLYALDALPELPGLSPADALGATVTLTASLASLERAADAAKYGMVSERPHVELTVPSLLAPGLAPEGKHVLVARVQYAPYRLAGGAAWDARRWRTLRPARSPRWRPGWPRTSSTGWRGRPGTSRSATGSARGRRRRGSWPSTRSCSCGRSPAGGGTPRRSTVSTSAAWGPIPDQVSSADRAGSRPGA